MPTPIVVFVNNRPDKAARLFELIKRQTVRPNQLFCFCDAARNGNSEAAVRDVRNLARAFQWDKVVVHVVEREHNLGCATNIVLGVTEVLKSHDAVVVIEDDLIISDCFYESMVKMLVTYARQKLVFSVGGHPTIKRNALPEYSSDVIFSSRFSCWGWGTWADRWQSVVGEIRPFKNPYETWKNVPVSVGGDLRDGAKMLESQPLCSWAYPVAMVCLHRGYVHAHSRHYLVRNVGTDQTGQNSFSSAYTKFIAKHVQIVNRIPEKLPSAHAADARTVRAVRSFIDGACNAGFARIKGKILKVLRWLHLRKGNSL